MSHHPQGNFTVEIGYTFDNPADGHTWAASSDMATLIRLTDDTPSGVAQLNELVSKQGSTYIISFATLVVDTNEGTEPEECYVKGKLDSGKGVLQVFARHSLYAQHRQRQETDALAKERAGGAIEQ